MQGRTGDVARRARGRWWSALGGLAAVAVATALLILSRGRPRPDGVALDVEVRAARSRVSDRMVDAVVGDVVVLRARGADTLWVYDQQGVIAGCPGPSTCARRGDALVLELELTRRGYFQVLALRGGAAITSSNNFDIDLLGVRRLAVKREFRTLRVKDAP